MPAPVSRFPRHFTRPTGACVGPSVTSIKKEEEGVANAHPALKEEETPMQGSRKSEEGDATSDLLLKHQDATHLATYV
jgi:hypothetical protein